MGNGTGARTPLEDRAGALWEAARASFGALTGVAMVLGIVLGFGLPSVDALLDTDLPLLEFASEDPGRGLLETIATATVSVAGLAFSVTLVAFTLASQQLSPRVLRTFRTDLISQATLACFLGTFIYCLAVLVRLGGVEDDQQVPNLSITVAIVLAIVSFALFAAFIGHIVDMLQPSSIIEGIRVTGREHAESPYPQGIGGEPDDPVAAERELRGRHGGRTPTPVRCEAEGYITSVFGHDIVEAAAEHDALVVQRAPIGDFVALGTVLADVWCAGDAVDDLVDGVRSAFAFGAQRTPVQDEAFPIRQLSDIALKGLSPGINDPTTAETAMESITAVLVRAIAVDRPGLMRTDADGTVRFVADAPDIDDLVRLGFEQTRVFAAPYPVFARRMIVLLRRIDDAARRHGVTCTETARQAALFAQGPDGEVPTASDAAAVRATYSARWGTFGR